MTRTVLVTGGSGFLGQACARRFYKSGWRVIGLGRGHWSFDEARAAGYNRWINADLTDEAIEGLINIVNPLHAVVHCAGKSSVPYSFFYPFDSYDCTVNATSVLLEQLRLHAPKAVVLYPSSAAVYGAAPDRRLQETDTPNPVSPYGFHKEMVERLLAAHVACFGQPAVAVRFFSIYGPGLRKQLLWDASARLLSGDAPQTFFGTGEETRDWIHVDDAAGLMLHLAERTLTTTVDQGRLEIINGASGVRVTVRDILEQLRFALDSSAEIGFDGNVRVGDPRFYHADIGRMRALGWSPKISLDKGLADYSAWARAAHLHDSPFP
jgi:UDP-glucose 4-epimerase